ncbi:MAG: FKBP-type peptidyl-prolyl cis-trans isomerase [Rickettsiales bacterium]
MLRNKQRPPQMAPTWLKYILFAFIGYALFIHFTGNGVKEAEHNSNAVSKGIVTSNAREYRQSSGVTIGGDIAGTGEDAMCGQTAIVKVTGKYKDGSVIEGVDGSKEITIQVGSDKDTYPWSPGVIGMKTGGIREVLIPVDEKIADAKNLDKSEQLQYRIELGSLSPSLPQGTVSFRASELTIGRGEEIRCGDKVKLHLDLWGPDGNLLYSTLKEKDKEPLTMTIGSSELFYGIDRGVLGMREGGGRSLVVPPAYLVAGGKGAEEFTKIIEKLPKDAIVLADVTVVEKVRR